MHVAAKRLLIFVLGTLCVVAHGADSAPLKLIATIPLVGVKGRFDHFSIDAKGGRLFVAALGNNSVEVIDLAGGKRVRSVAGMSKPQGVLFLAERNELLIANGEDGTLKVLDGTDFKVKHSLTELPDADNVRRGPHSGAAWVGYGEGGLAEITADSHKLTRTIKLPGHPESFQLEKQGSRIFINIPDTKQIAVVDANKREIVGKWPMEKFQGNFPMALDEGDRQLFVGCRKPARLVILDTARGDQLLDMAISGDTDDLFYDAERKRIYVACGEGFIDVISRESTGVFKPLGKVQTSPGARTCFFSSDLDRLYLAVPERGNQKAEIRVYRPE